MNPALGLFHFNIQYIAGDYQSYHRYATQVIAPFLHLIDDDQRYCVSFEISGSGLEFLAAHYPSSVSLLRKLVNQGRIELISATYSPTLWVAFPEADLRRSVQLNVQVLNKLRLEAAPIFFSQEAFTGPGLKCIDDLFRVAICKDDYVTHFRRTLDTKSAYRLGNLTMLIGAGHIRSSLLAFDRCSDLPLEAPRTLSPLWYHVGSGHHVTTSCHPHFWPQFFSDEIRIDSSRRFLDSLLSRGFCLSSIMAYADTLNTESLKPFPYIPEGSWNATESDGVFAWMGRQANHWECDVELLGLVWRARKAVRALDGGGTDGVNDVPPVSGEELAQAWKLLVMAESSDPLGWQPLPGEVGSGRVAAERALTFALPLLEGRSLPHRRASTVSSGSGTSVVPYLTAKLFGGKGEIHWHHTAQHEQVCVVEFESIETLCGVSFLRESEVCAYSPSCLESEIQWVDSSEFSCSSIYLPLANGFITVGRDLHLIRINEYGQPAAAIAAGSRWLSFATSGNSAGKLFRWRFLALRCDYREALARANCVNII